MQSSWINVRTSSSSARKCIPSLLFLPLPRTTITLTTTCNNRNSGFIPLCHNCFTKKLHQRTITHQKVRRVRTHHHRHHQQQQQRLRPRASTQPQNNNNNDNNNNNEKWWIAGNGSMTRGQKRTNEIVNEIETFSGTLEQERKQTIEILNEISTLAVNVPITEVYNTLVRVGRLKGFGRARRQQQHQSKIQYENTYSSSTPTMQEKAAIASQLPQRTGLPLSALTPNGSMGNSSNRRNSINNSSSNNSNGRRNNYNGIGRGMTWSGLSQLGLICSLWFLIFLARRTGYDVLRNVLYVLAIGISIDQGILSGALYSTLISPPKDSDVEKIIAHEAGHFFIAYMYGLPIQKYALTAWDALKNRVPGQAATLFADDELSEQLASGKVAISTLDRYSIVAMAGLAAEALNFGVASGGESDVNGLVSLLTGLKPSWEEPEIRVQARWAVVRAVDLIKTERKAYDSLREAMDKRLELGECILRIEDAMGTDDDEEHVEGGESLTNGGHGMRLDDRERDLIAEIERVAKKVSQLDDDIEKI